MNKGTDIQSAESTQKESPNGGATINATREVEVDENLAPGDAKTANEEVSGVEIETIGVFQNQRRKQEK